MSKYVITVVVGPPGVGKTTWIRQQLAQTTGPVLYFSPATGTVPIDQTRIVTEEPEVKILVDGQESQILEHLEAGMSAYIELGFNLELEAMDKPGSYLYNPYASRIEFRTVRYGAGKGFQQRHPKPTLSFQTSNHNHDSA